MSLGHAPNGLLAPRLENKLSYYYAKNRGFDSSCGSAFYDNHIVIFIFIYIIGVQFIFEIVYLQFDLP